MSRIILRMLVGCLAGLIAWALIEPTAPAAELSPAWGAFEIHMVLGLGVLAGLGISAFDALLSGSKLRLIFACILGPILGPIGSLTGYSLGSFLQRAIFHRGIETMTQPSDIVVLYLSRIVALTPIGTMLGLAIGLASVAPFFFLRINSAKGTASSPTDLKRLTNGIVGGTIGGAIGAMLFDPIAVVFGAMILASKGTPEGAEGEIGIASRVIYFVVMSGCIALFIGIVEQIAKQASLRLALGRNEGRDFPLFGQRSVIGRNELAQVPVFHDPAVAPIHAFVDKKGPVYYLVDAGSGAPTFLNGQPVLSAPLDHGATVQVGNTVFQFFLKALPKSLAPQRAYNVVPGQQVMPQQMPHPAMQMGMAQPLPAGPAMPMPVQVPSLQPYQPAPAAQVSQPTTVVPAQQAQPMVQTLVATDGPLIGQRFPLTGPLEIGREAPGLPLRFDSSASRRHASISPSPAGLMLQDLGSTNGTFVNGQRVATATIRTGDLVKIGATTFRVE